MDTTFKRITPDMVFISALEREATEAELWVGIPKDFTGNRPSGNNFIDLFASLVRKYGRCDTPFIAKKMGLTMDELNGVMKGLSGMVARDWQNQYVLLMAKELLKETDMPINEISARLGFNFPGTFSRFFVRATKKQPWEYRKNKKFK